MAYHKEDEYSFVPSCDCICDGGPLVGPKWGREPLFESAQSSSSVFGCPGPGPAGIWLNREHKLMNIGSRTSPKAEARNGDAAVKSAFETGCEVPNKQGRRNISVLKLTIARTEKKLLT